MPHMKKILLIQHRQLGDILLTTPCISAIHAQFPETSLDFLSHRMGNMILKDLPQIAHLYTYHESDSLQTSWQLIKTLRANRYDLVIDFMNNPRSAIQTWLTGAPKRISFKSNRALAYTTRISHPKEYTYIVKEKFQLLQSLGIEYQNEPLLMPWHKSDLHATTDFRNQLQRDNPQALKIVLSPTHRRVQRQWSLQSYIQMADYLVREHTAQVIWIWGPGEENMIDQAMKSCQEKTFKIPATSLRELTAFLAHCDYFIGNSNGPSHLTIAAGTCSLQLHGHTNAYAWCPMNHQHRAIQSPSFGNAQPYPMADITVEDVKQKFLEHLPVINEEKNKRDLRRPFENWLATHISD